MGHTWRKWVRDTEKALSGENMMPNARSVETKLLYTGKEIQEKWSLVTDEEIEGKSRARLRASDSDPSIGMLIGLYCVLTFIAVFEGHIDTYCPPHANKSGYAALLSPMHDPPLDLSMYDALEFGLSFSSPFTITSNIRSDTPLPEDLHQSSIHIDSAHTKTPLTISLPFSSYILTNQGHVESIQHAPVMDACHSISLLAAQRSGGSFCIEISYIAAKHMSLERRQKRYQMSEDEPNHDPRPIALQGWT